MKSMTGYGSYESQSDNYHLKIDMKSVNNRYCDIFIKLPALLFSYEDKIKRFIKKDVKRGKVEVFIKLNKLSKDDNYHLKIDMKSVNNRYCDIFIKLPALLFSYEDKIKRFIKKDVKRGKVEVFIKLNKLSKDDNSFDVDLPLAKNYYNASRDISNYLGLNNDLSIKDIITMPGVLVESEDNEVSKELEDLLFTTLTKTLESFITSRLSEGQAIKEDFKTKLSSIKDIVAKVEELSPISLKEMKKN